MYNVFIYVLNFKNILIGKNKYFCICRKILEISMIFFLQIKCCNILLYIYIINNFSMFHKNIFIICVLIPIFIYFGKKQ